MHPFSAYYFSAEVAKSVDAVDSKSTVEIRAGSSPAFGTISMFENVRNSPQVTKIKAERLFLGLNPSEHIRCNPDPAGGIIGGIPTSIRNVPPK